MKIVVVGASGATGMKLVEELLELKHEVHIVVRSIEKLPESWKNNAAISLREANLLDLDNESLMDLVRNCDAVASCLGHNLNFKGIYGAPRKLVTEATSRLCKAIEALQAEKKVKFVLMNTTGNRNPSAGEQISLGQQLVIGLLRLLLPPHVDNEQAAAYLLNEIGAASPSVEWVVVRPDNLIDEEEVSSYDTYASPIRSAIFDPGKTSRINVAHFMSQLIDNTDLWQQWKGQMPVIYNSSGNS
ncbi:NAD(P)-dependent oxidoreductase [Lutimonas sp.]|uniref:NAD(P)-dependent oxidoreductase n=1 Tax=Lutimonas sp. TaxID=1872403 RepID=UPI003D9BBCC0